MTYWGIFWICFMAATVMPVGSEPAVGAMAAVQKDIWGLLIAASLGNYFGAVVNYAAGRWGGTWCLRRFFEVKPETLQKAERLYGRWGAPSLFFAWLPVVGDPLTIIAGLLRVHPLIFTLWVLPGKTLRYFLVIMGVETFLV